MSKSRDRFVKLAEARTRKTIRMIQLIGNLSNRTNYKFSDDAVAQIFRALNGELRRARQRFEDSNNGLESEQFTLRDEAGK